MKVAVTGVTSDFGTAIVPPLCADPDIEVIVGTGRREPRVRHPKLRFERHDIRSADLEQCFAGCDVVVHLAFVVEELRDKELTHDINIRGTQNVIACAHAAGVQRVVIASSTSAYGFRDLPRPVDEDVFPLGDQDRYYTYDKAMVEHYASWWNARHPELPICLLRPPFVFGPHTWNLGISTFCAATAVVPDPDRGALQLLHERDLAAAFHLAVKQPLNGPFNLAPPDWIRVRELGAIHGQRQIAVPERPARRAADVLYRLRLLPTSGEWVFPGEPSVDSGRFERESGWRAMFDSIEVAHIMALQRGRPIVCARAMRRRDVAEAALETATDVVLEWATDPTELADVLDGVEHVFLPLGDGEFHLEAYPNVGTGAASETIVFAPLPGLHARLYAPWAAALAGDDRNVVVVNPPGHGLSTGRRGDAPAESVDAAVARAAAYAAERCSAPVRVVAEPLGAIGPPRRALRALGRLAPSMLVPLTRVLDSSRLPSFVKAALGEPSEQVVCARVTARTALRAISARDTGVEPWPGEAVEDSGVRTPVGATG